MHFLRPFQKTQTSFNEVAVDVFTFPPPPPCPPVFFSFFSHEILIDRILRRNTHYKKVIVTTHTDRRFPILWHTINTKIHTYMHTVYTINLRSNHLADLYLFNAFQILTLRSLQPSSSFVLLHIEPHTELKPYYVPRRFYVIIAETEIKQLGICNS